MEFNVIEQIKNYWNKFTGSSDNKQNEEFVDATSEHRIRASKFFTGLNIDPIMPEINKLYDVKEGKEKYPRRAMVKAMIFKKIKQIKYYTKEVVEAGDKNGLKIGQNTGTDSTPIEVPNDPAGTYNGHYKKIMVKTHITSDYDNANWRHNVNYEHKFEGKVYNYTPDQEINYLYRKRWQEPDYKKDASLEYMKDYLGLETHINGKGLKNIDLHVTEAA